MNFTWPPTPTPLGWLIALLVLIIAVVLIIVPSGVSNPVLFFIAALALARLL